MATPCIVSSGSKRKERKEMSKKERERERVQENDGMASVKVIEEMSVAR